MARDKLKNLVLDKYVRYEAKARDEHGRVIAQVWVNGLDVNEEMKRYIQRIMP
jgi:endonuclease YncB( thermonuclease family)